MLLEEALRRNRKTKQKTSEIHIRLASTSLCSTLTHTDCDVFAAKFCGETVRDLESESIRREAKAIDCRRYTSMLLDATTVANPFMASLHRTMLCDFWI